MSRRAALALALWAALASCAAQPPYRAVPAPQVPVLGADIPAGTTAWSNASLARVFTALAFDMETGATRPGLMRLEQPVEVALEGPGSGQYAEFLDDYLHGLGSQTGIAIGRGVEGARSRIRLRLVEARSFARSEPSAACVLTPGASSWGAFRRGGPAGGSEAVTVFIPASAPPHVIRGCIAEEVAQALGLANDIYGLGPSIFNDDAAHVRPTALDLLMLRVLYAPELAPGMDRDAAEAAAERALDRLNPAGRDAPALVFMPDTALGEWRGIAVRVTSRDATPVTRAERARAAVTLAERRAPRTPQHCQSLTALGQAKIPLAPGAAAETLSEARQLCAQVHGQADIRLARLRLDEAAALLAAGRPDAALTVSEGIEAPLAGHAHDARLATLYALRARAYRALGQDGAGDAAQRLAAEWGAFAYGANHPGLARALAP